MMKFQLLSDNRTRAQQPVPYESTMTLSSRSLEGVEFTIRRLSFARRMELARNVLELSRRFDFRQAGEGIDDTLEANMLNCEIDQLYLRWGLVDIRNLEIDGVAASAEMLIEKGPEKLAREVVTAIKQQCGLTEDERKN